ncbi:MAG: thioredoxin family protein [Hyphomicrobiaceae bacterium]
MSLSVIATDAVAFDQVINSGNLVIAKFRTKACVVCRRLEPALMQLKQRTTDMLDVVAIDAEDVPVLAERHNIRSVPTLILFKGGTELARCSGFQTTAMLREWMAPHIGQ